MLAGGLAATFAESISMGAVAYTSTVARREFHLAEYEREKREMEEVPEQEEVRNILERWGVPSKELEDVLVHITMKPKAWLDIMMAHELNLSPVDETQATKSALLVCVAAIVGSLIPLLPFIFAGSAILMGIIGSLVLSALTLFLIGW